MIISIWFVCGLIGGLLLVYQYWDEGNSVGLEFIPLVILSGFLGIISLLFGLIRVDENFILIKGRKK